MPHTLRVLSWAALLGTLSTLAEAAETTSPAPVDPQVVLHWNQPGDTSTVYTGAAMAPLELVATISDVDTIMGFEIEIRVLRSKTSDVWRFVALEDCGAATLDADARGTREVPAPWRSKLLLSDAREMEAGRSRLMALGAFHREPLDTAGTYTLCRFRLTPPGGQNEGCPGWDSGATFELVRAAYLRDRELQIDLSRLGSPLVFELLDED